MAEFALGLTKTAVEGTVSRVKSAIDEEEKLKVRVRNDLVFITGEFEMMQSFLNVANKERAKNEVVRTWVRQIRTLAFDVEDCVELVVGLDIKSGWSWLWRVLPGCVAPPRPLDQAVAEIQRLKARVEDVSHRNTRYNLIGDSGSSSSTSKHALATIVSSPAPELMLPASADVGASLSAFHILRGVWEDAGKMRTDMSDLKKLITSEGSDLEVISLWGSPGSVVDLGTTSIVRKAYNDLEICQDFKIRAWVKLMHPFNLDEFLKSLFTQLYATSPRHQANLEPCFRTTQEYQLIKAELMQQVSQQRYLVIVEQLSSVVEWDAIRMYLPNSKNGSRIVVMTQQLGHALSCTGEPYQVSDLQQFSDGQSLCAFFNKVSGRRSDMGELIWQLRCGGVISVWRYQLGKTTLVEKVYTGITHKSKDFDGVEFHRHSWVDVPSPFDLGVFSRRLFLNLHSDDLRATKIAGAGIMMDDADVIQGCCKFLREDDCLIVTNGVNSKDDWDLIKATFLAEPNKGCFLVITIELSVARYCVDEADRALNIKDLDADVVLRYSVKGCEYDGIEANEASSRGRFFSNRRKEAHDWTNKFSLVVNPIGADYEFLQEQLENPGVISLCGIDGACKSAVAREIYYDQILIGNDDCMPTTRRKVLDLGFTMFSWVDVPHPFDLTDFSWRLLLDFYSDDLKAKETAAVGMMEGCQTPIEGCLKFLRQDRCFVVIHGLRSMIDWDLIRDALLSKPTKGCILVITDEKSVATYCVNHEERVCFIDGQKADVASRPLIEKKGYSDRNRSRTYSSRMLEAREWTKKFKLIGRHSVRDCIHHCLQPSKGCVTSVWGIAGVGKSALVGSIYYNNMIGATDSVCSSLYEVKMYSWVDVSQSFNLRDFSRHLLMDFHLDGLEAKETAAIGMMEGHDPIQWCREFLHQHECFVVIDGLRSTDDWDLIKATFLSDRIKGYILVITNEESIATHCVDKKDQVVNVKGLEADVALNLFTKIAWGSEQLNSDEEDLSRLTTTKCGGLPKVIAAIGEYCHTSYIPKAKMYLSFLYQSKKRWLEIINANFMGTLETDPISHISRGLFSWMQSYFDNCPDSLKPCIFYLSVFPLGHNIRRRRLLRRWIAEGYSRDTPGSDAEENGRKFFFELVKLSIIHQQPSPSKVDVCQVNGFFREYIISRPMQDNLVFALEGRCTLNSQRVGQHLTISSSWDRDKILFESMELSRLRSLTVFGEWRSFFISVDVNMRLLRVLDLEDTSGVTDGDIEQIGKLLPRLKFLSLRGCKDITRLPGSLGGLRQLHTLDIKGTSIVTLPPAIMKLEKLQYVRAGTTQCISTSTEDHNGTVIGIATPPAVDGDGASTSPPPAVDGGGMITRLPLPPPATTTDDETRTSTPWSSKIRGGLAFSWLSKLRRHGIISSAHDGVQFSVVAATAEGIGKLTALHTLGVINVCGISGKAVLREVNKLTQLRKLRLSGINWRNWKDFCCVISGHGYLESLSIRLDEEQQDHLCCLGDISKPPKTLKSLKMYGGNVHVSPVWMKQLDSLIKAHLEDLELIISTQEDIDSLMEVPCRNMFRHLCVKPIRDGELRYGRWEGWWSGEYLNKVLKIDCGSYKLAIVFGPWIPRYVEVLVVQCSSTESSLEVYGIEELEKLKEVWLKGSYSEAVKQHLQQKVDEHKKKPVLKLEDQPHLS